MRTNQITPERMEAVRKLVEDGASQTEITRTTGMSRETVVKYFPSCGWSYVEAGSYGRLIRTAKHRGLL